MHCFLKKSTRTLFLVVILIANSAFSWGSTDKEYKVPKGSARSELGDDVALLKKMQRAFNTLADRSSPAVVYITILKNVPTRRYTSPFEEFFFNDPRYRREAPKRQVKGAGSGFIIDNEKGYILTNNHVVGEADEITVITHDDKRYRAKVIGTDKKTDIAVIQVKNLDKRYGQLFLAESDRVHVGDWAIAIGAPHELPQSVTRGIISATGRGALRITDYGDFLQTDAAINPGNSGGPLLNIDGDVIGMNTFIISQSGGNTGLSFSIPSSMLRRTSQDLINKGKVSRAYLGVHIRPFDSRLAQEFNMKKDAKGVVVSKVELNTPAERAGIQAGDVIVAVNKKKVGSPDRLSYQISISPLDREVPIRYYRDGKERVVHVNLAQFDDAKIAGGDKKRPDRWGLAIESNTRSLSRRCRLRNLDGVVVVGVKPGSVAESQGLQICDVIVATNRKRVNSVAELRKRDQRKGKVLLRVVREGHHLFFHLEK